MGFGNQNQKTSVSITPGGIGTEDVSTAQRGIPIPYLAGTGAIAARQICEEWGLRPVEIPASSSSGKSSGKAGGGSGSGRYNIYGSQAGLLCHGPIDSLHAVETDQTRNWSGDMALGSVNPAPVTVPNRGSYRFFLGTADQGTWGLPTPSWTYVPHPPYRRFAGFVADDILFGEGRTNPLSHRFIVGRRPRQLLISGAASLLDDGQANPFCVLAELLTSSSCGLGAPLSLFNQASWQAAADKAYATRALTYVSVLLSSKVQVKALAADLFALCDGYWRMHRESGGCEVGIFTQPQAINVSTLPLITYRGFIEPPDLDVLDDTVSRFFCSYTDREKNYQADMVQHTDPGAKGGVDVDYADEISRPYITRRAQAKSHLAEYSRRRALSGLAANVEDRQFRAQNLRPGDNLRLDIEPEPGGTQVEKVTRILATKRPYGGCPVYTVEAERTLTPVITTPPDTPPTQTEPTVAAIANAEFFELPPQLSDGGEYALGILAERPSWPVVECSVYYDPVNDTTATFPFMGSFNSFALRTELNAAVTDTAAQIDFHLLSTLSREIISDDPGPVAARNNELLAILLHALVDGRRVVEICSVDSIAGLSTDVIRATVLRGRCGTEPVAHASSTAAWLIRREALWWFRHNDFPARAAAGQTCYIILQPSTHSVARPLADCAHRSFLFETVRAYAPVITVTTPSSNPVGVEVNHALACSGSVDDADGNLTSISVLRSQDGIETVILDKNFAPARTMSFSIAAIPFTSEGSAAIIIRAQDSTRRTIEKRINVVVGTSGGGGSMPTTRLLAPVLIDSRVVAYPNYSTPFFYGGSLPLIVGSGPEDYILPEETTLILGWVRVHTASIGATPGLLVEYLAAASSLGASSPETDWTSITPLMQTNTYVDGVLDHWVTERLYNSDGGLAAIDAGSGPDGNNYLRPCLGLPRSEGGIRIWIKARDHAGLLSDSEIVYFDLYP